MALPKISVPKYKLKLPSDGRIVNFRPFLVKEEKILLLATESGEQTTIVDAIKNIIKECTDITDVEKLATFDIEFVFLQIRTKSVGESVDVNIVCPDDDETNVSVSIPLDDIKVKKTRGHKKDLKISEEVAITMGYPTIETFVAMNFGEGAEVDQVFDMAASCVESISDANQVYDCSTVPKKELIEFFDQMNSKQFMMIQEFFEKMPKLQHAVKVTNPNTGVESEVVLEGLASFFE
ncbi:baseplate hub subunit [Prochlorococcus phage P-SSM7]|uniref:Baseplate hub subunit n=1 Tax=Prochlorococcus phage P-SSM7 TaxID=445688 RepID=E3SP14_9CAUD|nr:baseplate hub [Prochlorococcus phage P-SSM7]ADO99094.1 baseplate hub subunit [Prochlorococcus phage P-SSM7]